MKNDIIFGLVFFCVLELIKGYSIKDYAKDYGEQRIEILLNSNEKIDYDYIKGQETYHRLSPILMTEVKDIANDLEKSINVVGTTYNYAQLERLDILDGTFFTQKSSEEKRNVAVISESLSFQLYGAYKASGNMIRLQGEAYEIVGVYKQYSRLRDYIMASPYEIIYVPITSSVIKDHRIEAVAIDGAYLEESPQDEDLQKMGITLEPDHYRKAMTWIKVNQSLSKIPLIILLGALLILSGQYCLTGIKQGFLSKRMIQKDTILIFLGFIIIAIGTYRLGATFYIPLENLPPENLFDLNFYWEQIKGEWITHNQFVQQGITHFEQAMYLLKLMIHILNLIQFAILLNIGAKIMKYKKLKSYTMKYGGKQQLLGKSEGID